jgi:hypothetical protein
MQGTEAHTRQHTSRDRRRRRRNRRIGALARVIVASMLVTAALTAGGIAATTTTTSAGAADAQDDSLGTDFWLAFPGNLATPPTLTLFITGPTATTGTVAAPGASFSEPFTVTPGTVTSVVVPSSLNISTSSTVENLGIHVTAGAEVTVYGLNRFSASTDAYLGLPTDILGTEYIVQGYRNGGALDGTQFAVVATQAATTVTITPTVTTDGHVAGTPYDVTLAQGQTYQLRNTGGAPADLSGSVVTANKPIAVFGGHGCANIPVGDVYCDHIVEQMTPTVTWGKQFVTEPLATRLDGDTFRFLAGTDDTVVRVNGAIVATLDRGELFEQLVTAASVVTATEPILVTQYSNSTSFDGVTSDPFEVVVPPAEQFLSSYTVTTPASGFTTNFINVVAPTDSLASVRLDGAAVPAASFTAIPGSTYSGAQLAVGLGSHTVLGSRPLGITVYGFATADSYGYPGGLSLAPVATVESVTLAPKTGSGAVGTQHCVTATALDQNDDPVESVRVDFVVTGANPNTGAVNTDAAGLAQFCYTGANAGADTITAAVGTVSDTATQQWSGTPTGLTVTGVATPEQITAGSVGKVRFTIRNGTVNPLGVTADITLPGGATPVSITTSAGTCGAFSGGTATCTFPGVSPGGTRGITVIAQSADTTRGPFLTSIDVSGGGGSASADAGPNVVAPTPGQASGFVPPGGSISTGTSATPSNNTVATLTLPNTGSGTRITLKTETTGVGTFCGGKACSGKILYVSPFSGYTDPNHPVKLKIVWDKTVTGKGADSTLYVQKVPGGAIRRVPRCTVDGVANPSPCVRKARINPITCDVEFEVLLLSDDPRFARR